MILFKFFQLNLCNYFPTFLNIIQWKPLNVITDNVISQFLDQIDEVPNMLNRVILSTTTVGYNINVNG